MLLSKANVFPCGALHLPEDPHKYRALPLRGHLPCIALLFCVAPGEAGPTSQCEAKGTRGRIRNIPVSLLGQFGSVRS